MESFYSAIECSRLVNKYFALIYMNFKFDQLINSTFVTQIQIG